MAKQYAHGVVFDTDTQVAVRNFDGTYLIEQHVTNPVSPKGATMFQTSYAVLNPTTGDVQGQIILTTSQKSGSCVTNVEYKGSMTITDSVDADYLMVLENVRIALTFNWPERVLPGAAAGVVMELVSAIYHTFFDSVAAAAPDNYPTDTQLVRLSAGGNNIF